MGESWPRNWSWKIANLVMEKPWLFLFFFSGGSENSTTSENSIGNGAGGQEAKQGSEESKKSSEDGKKGKQASKRRTSKRTRKKSSNTKNGQMTEVCRNSQEENNANQVFIVKKANEKIKRIKKFEILKLFDNHIGWWCDQYVSNGAGHNYSGSYCYITCMCMQENI